MQKSNQFIIPIYQRTYSWEVNQCQQLWRDVQRVGHDEEATGHFIGSVVYIAKGIYGASTLPQLLVIDGQQRLTTLTLLISALAKAIGKSHTKIAVTQKKLENYYLFNVEEEGEAYYKLLLTRNDKETLLRIVDGKSTPDSPSQRIIENHRFFEEQLARLDATGLEAVYEGIQKLIIVDISLDRDHDNPQLIFESLNATALKLTESDLIRNYVLMGLEPKEQTRLYEDHWFPIEQGFANSGWFDWFVRDYLTVKTGAIPNIREVYTKFKTYVQNEPSKRSIDLIVEEMHRYAQYFVRFTQNRDPTSDLNMAFKDINTLRVDVARPFFMQLYEDYETQVINKEIFLEILRFVESYVFRRAVCGIPTYSLNNTFAALHREIKSENYLDSFKAALLTKTSYRRFPDDEEFKREIVAKDVYNFRSRNYLLDKLENFNRKEKVEVDGYTIEHILPQNPKLRTEWQVALGGNWKSVQARLLHTLGNLTLTGYNSEYSDRPFTDKRDMEGGFKESPLRLNQGLGQLEDWNESESLNRAQRLADKAVIIWKTPALPDSILANYQTPPTNDQTVSYTLGDYDQYLTGDINVIFNEFSKRVLNLDPSARMEVKKLYIAFKCVTNFVNVIPQKSRLRLFLNIEFSEINDPENLCRDVSSVGHWGGGDVEVGLSNMSDIGKVMELVQQAFEKQMDEGSPTDTDA